MEEDLVERVDDVDEREEEGDAVEETEDGAHEQTQVAHENMKDDNAETPPEDADENREDDADVCIDEDVDGRIEDDVDRRIEEDAEDDNGEYVKSCSEEEDVEGRSGDNVGECVQEVVECVQMFVHLQANVVDGATDDVYRCVDKGVTGIADGSVPATGDTRVQAEVGHTADDAGIGIEEIIDDISVDTCATDDAPALVLLTEDEADACFAEETEIDDMVAGSIPMFEFC